MRKSLLLLAVCCAAAAGFAAGAWYNQRGTVSAAGLEGRRVLHYVDPMHPAYTSQRPGVAPDCGMPLEPVYADEERGDAPSAAVPAPRVVVGSGAIRQAMGVRVEPVHRTSLARQLRLSGRVVADETRVYAVDVGIDGFVRAASAVTTGSRVRKGEWLATFAAPEARSAIQGYLVAVEVLERTRRAEEGPLATELASAAVQQAADRLTSLGMASGQIEEIARTRQVPPSIRIDAPADGFVIARRVVTGQKLSRGDEAYRIADLRRVWILADVVGPEAEWVRPGAVASVHAPGRHGAFRAALDGSVPPQFDAATQTVQVRFEAENTGLTLKPDMFVDVDLPLVMPSAFAVPTEAVLDSGTKRHVFVERSPGVFEPREVRATWSFDGQVGIVDGLRDGERVAMSGAFLLDAESRLRR